MAEAEEEAGYQGPAFEQLVFRETWRCLMQCWDDEVKCLFFSARQPTHRTRSNSVLTSSGTCMKTWPYGTLLDCEKLVIWVGVVLPGAVLAKCCRCLLLWCFSPSPSKCSVAHVGGIVTVEAYTVVFLEA